MLVSYVWIEAKYNVMDIPCTRRRKYWWSSPRVWPFVAIAYLAESMMIGCGSVAITVVPLVIDR